MSAHTTFLTQMKENLIKRKVELRALLSGSNQQSSDMQVKDSGDEAVTTSMDSLQNSLTQSEVEELNQIDAALSRIERNEFGLCIDCGEQIIEKRLLHFPFAARCIICQEEVEQARQ